MKYLFEIEGKLSEAVKTVLDKQDEAMNIARETRKLEGKPGYTPVKGVDYFDGQNYVALTEQDKKDIASKVVVPVVDKVIERTVEVIREQPIIKETPIDKAVWVSHEHLHSLMEESRADMDSIKKLTEGEGFVAKVMKVVLESIPIRTLQHQVSFLVNRVGDLKNQLDRISNITGGSGFNVETPAGTVDGSNVTFTVSNTPKAVIIDGLYKVEGFGYTYSGGTITVDSDAPPMVYIRSTY